MKIKEVAKIKKPIDRLIYWIKERESIRLKREAGEEKPWTDDEILQRYRFCNVWRMDDKVSQWLLKNWYKPNFNHPNMLVACALARFINLPSSLEAIGFPKQFSPARIKRILRERRDVGGKTFNGAYMVRGNNGVDKIESVVDYNVLPLKKLQRKINSYSMEKTWKLILPSYGIGSFMAGQIVADLRWAMKGSWVDAKYWAPMGPGSKRGMNRLYSLSIETPTNQKQFDFELSELIDLLEDSISPSIFSRLEAIDFQNCLCEFDKYERTLFDGRKPKAIFRSEK